MFQERQGGGGGAPHGVILAVVVFIVVLAPFLTGDQGEAITEAISELLSPLGLLLLPIPPPPRNPASACFFSSSCSYFTLAFPSSAAVAMILRIEKFNITIQRLFACYPFDAVEDRIPGIKRLVAGDYYSGVCLLIMVYSGAFFSITNETSSFEQLSVKNGSCGGCLGGWYVGAAIAQSQLFYCRFTPFSY
ncbi:hypothetical protein F3Y22_tig00110044pilonHSYRG00382 [Hibiscus syriacus]|uniref:Uncharacterized protein n=1 Tax=Hibiscus syriacus TaxID=106335 RepID=A0A6A3BKX8_HIBSY|nr:hypothetical protein F3Y22_tig00110044pilonHSYRG00382 [Hibiscus syriacus]